jgi:hypothetical protein
MFGIRTFLSKWEIQQVREQVDQLRRLHPDRWPHAYSDEIQPLRDVIRRGAEINQDRQEQYLRGLMPSEECSP